MCQQVLVAHEAGAPAYERECVVFVCVCGGGWGEEGIFCPSIHPSTHINKHSHPPTDLHLHAAVALALGAVGDGREGRGAAHFL